MYRLSGLCCTSITFPQIRMGKNQSFTVDATYYTFNGAVISNVPVVVVGGLMTIYIIACVNSCTERWFYILLAKFRLTHLTCPGKS